VENSLAIVILGDECIPKEEIGKSASDATRFSFHQPLWCRARNRAVRQNVFGERATGGGGVTFMATMVRAGRYEILGELGRGAMGVVYKASDPVIGRPVAVKTIHLSVEGTGLTRPELLARFQTEARAAGLLTHPNIVVVYDAGEENGLYYITMELVEGRSLQALLDAGHSFPTPRVLRIMEQTASALQFAHERNIIHRDIKPANLMLTADDTVKVTDFGTAKILQFGTVQQTTHVMGTPSYMSPEQVKGRPVDGRSDIFSLGVMLYEMLTGEKPFPGQSITTVIYKIVNEEPIAPRQLNPTIHPGLNSIALRALAKEPEVRYQSCREMLEDLRNYRALGGSEQNPDATMISARASSPMAMASSGAGLRGLHGDPSASPAPRSLQSASGNPSQTPVVRRTGAIQTFEEPEKRSRLGSIFAALVMLSVIVYGGFKLRPEFQATRERNNAYKAMASAEPAAPQATSATPAPAAEPSASTIPDVLEPPSIKEATSPAPADPLTKPGDTAPAQPDEAAKSPLPTAITEKKAEPPVAAALPASGSPVNTLSPAAAEYKGRIEEALVEKGLPGRVKISVSGNTLSLSGKLRPIDHARLLQFMRNAPASVRVVDDIQYDDRPVAVAENIGNGNHPVPSKGNSVVHVVTDVVGATVTLFGVAGRAISECLTPCSFNNIAPARYSLQIQKDGYLPVQTAIALKMNESQDQEIHLEALARGLYVSSRPSGAEIFINGAKQSGETPATLPLAVGQYDLVLRLPGYDAYAGHIQVKDNIQTTLDVELKEKSQVHVAWAQVDSTPKGGEIFVDGAPTGQTTPARVQIPTGSHIIAVQLNGFQVAKRGVQTSEGGTILVNEVLRPK
jgi:eukaryotic-like serine/threonine-protein kinase